MAQDETKAIRLRILGRVQGVGYRAWCVTTARHLELVGWVRNLTDGSVEVFAQGRQPLLETLIASAQAGPPGARVTEVRSTPVDPMPDLAGFRQLPDAAPDEKL